MIRKSLEGLELQYGNNEVFLPHRLPLHVKMALILCFSEESQINKVAGNVLSDRLEKAHNVPISLGKFLNDIGFLGATPGVKQILEGTYVYPLGMDKHTRLLLEEAALISAKTVGGVIATFVTTKDFQDWWLTADENIQSSKSGAHFGHYKAEAHMTICRYSMSQN